jgi:hypothetical protein
MASAKASNLQGKSISKFLFALDRRSSAILLKRSTQSQTIPINSPS